MLVEQQPAPDQTADVAYRHGDNSAARASAATKL
jgi:hypothetical protein